MVWNRYTSSLILGKEQLPPDQKGYTARGSADYNCGFSCNSKHIGWDFFSLDYATMLTNTILTNMVGVVGGRSTYRNILAANHLGTIQLRCGLKF